MKQTKYFIDPVPPRINVAFEDMYGQDEVEAAWYTVDSIFNSTRDCLWEIVNALNIDSRK